MSYQYGFVYLSQVFGHWFSSSFTALGTKAQHQITYSDILPKLDNFFLDPSRLSNVPSVCSLRLIFFFYLSPISPVVLFSHK